MNLLTEFLYIIFLIEFGIDSLEFPSIVYPNSKSGSPIVIEILTFSMAILFVSVSEREHISVVVML